MIWRWLSGVRLGWRRTWHGAGHHAAILCWHASGRLAVTGHPHAGERHMGIATLVTWLLTVGIGAYMLRTWIARGGPRMQRAGADRLPPVVVYGHASLAVTGLAIWISYLATSLAALAWSAAGLLMPVIGLGAAMVTVWTPYPVPATGGTGLSGGVLTTPAEDALAG